MPWTEYFKATKNLPPNDLLVKALVYVRDSMNGGPSALDLGAGALRDSTYLVANGFDSVVSVDSADGFLSFPKDDGHITLIQSSFVDFFKANERQFDLVNAQWALSFNPQKSFPFVIDGIKKALSPGGIFVGNIFGVDDQWNDGKDDMVFIEKEACLKLFSEMDLMYFAEVFERKAPAAGGPVKQWHYFDIIARNEKGEALNRID